MKEIILDNSVISSFLRIKKLNLLREILRDSRVVITPEVYSEIINGKIDDYDFIKEIDEEIAKTKNELSDKKWILIIRVEGGADFAEEHKLGVGEASVIKLTQERESVAGLDEKKGRKTAKELKIKFTGTIGLLKRGYEVCLIKDIPDLKKILNDLQKTGFRITDELRNWTLSTEKREPCT